MDEIVLLEGNDLEDFLATMVRVNDRTPRIMRFAIDGGLKVKIGEGVWSPPMGELVTSWRAHHDT